MVQVMSVRLIRMAIHEVSISSDFLDLFITFIFFLPFSIILKLFLPPFNFPEVK